jgi:PiT family inorganic phosphate transporter
MIIFCISLALIYDFLNGFNDSGSLVAAVISSRALSPRWALRVTALGELLGPFLFGVAVARTIGGDLLDTSAINLQVILAGLIAAIVWNLITWYGGIPSSSSHALIGGLVGPAILAYGLNVVKWGGLLKIVLALTLSPVFGLLAGYLFTKIIYLLSSRATPRVNDLFRVLQSVTLFGLALSHGANDSQKTMGVITLVLLIGGIIPSFYVPQWVIVAAALAIAAGASFGGWRQIRTLGGKVFRVRHVHGVSAQLASAGVIAVAALVGGPVSTTQVISSAIIGAGAAERFGKVRWSVGQDMLTAWLLTIPVTAIFSSLVYLLATWLLRVL